MALVSHLLNCGWHCTVGRKDPHGVGRRSQGPPLPARDPYLGQVLPKHFLKDIPEPSLGPPGPPLENPQTEMSLGRGSAHGPAQLSCPSSPWQPLGTQQLRHPRNALSQVPRRLAGPQQEGGKPQAVQGKTQTVPLLTHTTLAFPTSLPTYCRGNGKTGGGRKTSFLGSSAIASPCIRISGAWCWRKGRQNANTQGTVYSGTCALLMGCLVWPPWGCGPSDTQCWGGLGLWGVP